MLRSSMMFLIFALFVPLTVRGGNEPAKYVVESIRYEGPHPAAPFFIRLVGDRIAGQSKRPDCDINRLVDQALKAWNRKTEGRPYWLSDLGLTFDPGGRGKCGENHLGVGKLTVSYSAEGKKTTKSFCETCRAGLIIVCMNDLTQSALAYMNSGREVAANRCID